MDLTRARLGVYTDGRVFGVAGSWGQALGGFGVWASRSFLRAPSTDLRRGEFGRLGLGF